MRRNSRAAAVVHRSHAQTDYPEVRRNALLWVPRILIILFALFTLVYTPDVFSSDLPINQRIMGIVAHSVPFIVLMLLLWVTWHRPLWGTIAFIIVSAAFMVMFRFQIGRDQLMYYIIPSLLIALLFLADYIIYHKRKPGREHHS